MSDKEKNILDHEHDEHDMEEAQTIVFSDDDGNEIEFEEIAFFEYEGKNYSALVLADPQNEEEASSVTFCEVEETEEFENLTIVEDEALSEKLFQEFLKLQEEYMAEGGGCGCGCGGCEGGGCEE